jgi:hypothetical protein
MRTFTTNRLNTALTFFTENNNMAFLAIPAVASWLGGMGLGATASTVGAGALTGAATGAGVSAATGGDPLKGGGIGALTGGIASGAGAALDAGAQAAGMGSTAGGVADFAATPSAEWASALESGALSAGEAAGATADAANAFGNASIAAPSVGDFATTGMEVAAPTSAMDSMGYQAAKAGVQAAAGAGAQSAVEPTTYTPLKRQQPLVDDTGMYDFSNLLQQQ